MDPWGETTAYLTEQLRQFIRPRERVLLCFTAQGSDSLCGLLCQALQNIKAIPILWGPDFRWKTLLRQAFSQRVTAVIGGASAVAALAKMATVTSTPLSIRNALLCGAAETGELEEDIRRRLDCKVWRCYCVGQAEVAAFSCPAKQGMHLRTDRYEVQILNQAGFQVLPGEIGQLALTDRLTGHEFQTGDRTRLSTEPCPCGCQVLLFSRIRREKNGQQNVKMLEQQLQTIGSILDCRANLAAHGLELEVVTFSGAKPPKLPACAKRVVRTWNPERDTPLRGDFYTDIQLKFLIHKN